MPPFRPPRTSPEVHFSGHRTAPRQFLPIMGERPLMAPGATYMDLKASLGVSASGLRAQSLRMRVIAENLANQDSVAQSPGGNPYRRRIASFAAEVDKSTGATEVKIKNVETDKSDFTRVYQPGHPAAD